MMCVNISVVFVLCTTMIIILFLVTTTLALQPKQFHTCDVCGLDFKKTLEFERHLAGRRHAENLVTYVSPEKIWLDFQQTHWSQDCSPDHVAKMWSLDELSTLGLKFRTTCLHPSPTVGKLQPYQRARLWRYIRDIMGPYYSELGNILAAVDLDEEGHVRVKELFENLEAFKVISRFVIAANKTRVAEDNPPLESIVELAGGHGLLSVLLAYRFPQLQVVCYDLLKRKTYDAFIRAFETKGVPRPDKSLVLPNMRFYEQDMKHSSDFITSNSVVICLHGCGEVNEVSINLAQDKNAGWMVMPCCIKKGQYLHESCNVLLDDDSRYLIMCGALASRFNAQILVNIDSRITNRHICIGGGIEMTSEPPKSVDSETQGRSVAVMVSESEALQRAVKTRNLPRLQYH